MTNVPGLSQQREIEERLPTLSPSMRAAFVAACAERVLPVLEDYYGTQRAECRRALDLTWRFALGESVPEAERQSVVDACEALVDPLYDEDEDGATLYALNAISYALQSTLKPEAEPAELAISNASDAASTDDLDRGDEYISEEADWQLLAFEVASRATGVKRDMFAHLPAPPRWLTNFYNARATHPPID